jgi:hypothetical protein
MRSIVCGWQAVQLVQLFVARNDRTSKVDIFTHEGINAVLNIDIASS